MRIIVAFLILVFAASCGESDAPLPKPRMYPRVDFPERNLETFQTDYCNFTFEKPSYTQVIQDEKFFDEDAKDPCWFDLYYPAFDAKIHCSYYPIDSKERFIKLKNDAFVLSQKHNIVANYIDEIPVSKSESVKGFIFSLEGEVASPVQFYLSDEKTNFLRGALYFNTKSRPDSLAPMVNFIKADVLKLVETFEWN